MRLRTNTLSILLAALGGALLAAPPETDSDKGADSEKAAAPVATGPNYKAIREEAIGLKFDTFKVRTRTYNKVVITGIDDIGVKIRHEAGTARLKFVELPAKMRTQFGYNPKASVKAKEVAKGKEAELAKLTDEQRAKLVEKETKRQEARTALMAKQEKSKAASTIKDLEAKIRKMELGITQANAEAKGLLDRAARYRSQANYVVTRRDANGFVVTEQRVSKGKLKMADNFEHQAEQQNLKIRFAKDLINKYEREIRDLEKFLRKAK